MTDYKFTALTHLAAVTAAIKVPVVDPNDTTTAPADASGSNKYATIGDIFAAAGYYFPSGDTSGVKDRTAINAIIAALGTVRLIAADYYIDQPLVPAGSATTAAAIIGEYAGWGVDNDFYGTGVGTPTGTRIITVSTFVGEAAILMDNETSTQYMAPTFRNFVVWAEQMPAQTGGLKGHGIEMTGPWAAATWENLLVDKPQGSCYVFQDAITGSGNPDNMIVRGCKASSSRTAYGWLLAHCPDAVFSDCEGSECFLDAWLLIGVTNSTFVNCKGENSGNNGWHAAGFYSAGSYAFFACCTSNENGKNGWLFDTTFGAGGGYYVLSGCKGTNDGQSATGYAAFRATGSGNSIQGHGLLGLGCSYGALMESASHEMQLTGSFAGSTAATHDDGSNTSALAVLDMTNGIWTFTGGTPAILIRPTGSPAAINFSGQSNGAYYSGFNLGDNIYPLDATGHYWGVQHTSAHTFLFFNYNGAGTYKNVLTLSENGNVLLAHNTPDDGSGNSTVTGTLGVTGATTLTAVAHLNGGTDTSSTATASSPTFTTGTAQTLSTTQDVMLYIAVKVSIAVTLSIGPTSGAATSIVPVTTMPVGAFVSVLIPKGWFVKLTCATMADLQITQVTC